MRAISWPTCCVSLLSPKLGMPLWVNHRPNSEVARLALSAPVAWPARVYSRLFSQSSSRARCRSRSVLTFCTSENSRYAASVRDERSRACV
ncbi:hypothetical protein D3C72_1590420 [compost metagenome]